MQRDMWQALHRLTEMTSRLVELGPKKPGMREDQKTEFDAIMEKYTEEIHEATQELERCKTIPDQRERNRKERDLISKIQRLQRANAAALSQIYHRDAGLHEIRVQPPTIPRFVVDHSRTDPGRFVRPNSRDR